MVPDFPARLVEALPRTNALLTRKARQAGFQPADIEDLKQVILIKALEAGPRFDRDRPIGPWLNTIAINTLRDRLDSLKCKSRPRFVSLDQTDDDGNLINEIADRSPGPDVLASSRPQKEPAPEKDPRVAGVLAGMNKAYRPVIRLMLAGKANKDIADKLGMPANTVGTIIHRFRKQMKKVMG